MERKIVFEKVIPPESAFVFLVKKGQYLRIIDLEGKQCGDFVLFNEHDHSVKLSASYTRWHAYVQLGPKFWQTLQGITTGHTLMSTIDTPMMTIVADIPVPGGIHDFLCRMCTSWAQTRTGHEPRPGCLELLTEALAPHDIAPGNIPDPMNVFMNVHYDPSNGMLLIDEPVSRPGDYIELRAEMDLLAGLTACPEHMSSLASGHPPHPPKPLKIQISEE